MLEFYDHEGGVNQGKRFVAALERYRDTKFCGKNESICRKGGMGRSSNWKGYLPNLVQKNKKQEIADDDYQYVFEDQIDFIKESLIGGVNDEEELTEEGFQENEGRLDVPNHFELLISVWLLPVPRDGIKLGHQVGYSIRLIARPKRLF
ncbi:hypothetical protein Syun_011578 [Stephania yunnanensis]|uniref:Uncharacterized protein n=1 Tax=Stephania yunnanensis TaxID=152371 RepID=A0AAP0PEH4_9MAGN